MPSADYANIADLYDTYVNTTFDIPYWLDLARHHATDILELMCGTGRVTMPLLQAGYAVTAIDNSPELLAVLRQKVTATGLQATVLQEDVMDFALGRVFKLIILPFNAFAELQTPAAQLKALQTIRRHLDPGGVFVCTLHNPAVRLQTVDGQLRVVASYSQPDGELVFLMHQRYHEAERRVHVMQFYEEYGVDGLLRQKRLQKMAFSIIDRVDFERMATEAGFDVVALYGNYDHTPFAADSSPFMIWHLAHGAR